jgi:hypothetical protein
VKNRYMGESPVSHNLAECAQDWTTDTSQHKLHLSCQKIEGKGNHGQF